LSSEFEGKAFIVGGFQKLYELVKSNSPIIEELRKRVSLIVVDEAHRVTAPTYAAVTKAFMGEDTRVVGLTATPGKSAIDSEQNQELAEFFFSTLVDIQPEPKDMDVIDYLRKKKVLASAMYVPLVTGRDYELTPRELKQLEESFDFPPSFLARLGLDQIRNLEILKKIQGEIEIGNTILFFGATVEQSKLVSGVLRMLGIAADHIDGKTPRAQRHAMIDSFRNGRLSVLCNFGVLSTGFDAPKTDVVFIARPTQSIVLYSQMIGRGLRGPAIGGTDTCKIIDVLDNIKGYSDQNSVYSYFEEYFNQ
jgi:superfamily II DNA or RNA helicase